MMSLFWAPKTPQEQLREWQSTLRAEQRKLERQVREIQREERGVQKSVKDAAKRGDMKSAKILAKELVHSRRTVARLYENKAQLNSINMQLKENLAVAKAVGHFQKSASLMKSVSSVVRVPEMMSTMRDMSREMMKAGIIEGMVTDAMDSALGDEDELEEETAEEIDKVLRELAVIDVESMPAMPVAAPEAARAGQEGVQATEDEEEEEEEIELDAGLQRRLDAIRS